MSFDFQAGSPRSHASLPSFCRRVGSSRVLDTKTDIAWSYFIHKIMRIWHLNSMNNTEGRNYSLQRQPSRTTFTEESAVATVKCGFLWKTSFHTGRTSSKSRYFVLTRSSLDHFRNNQTVVINFFTFCLCFWKLLHNVQLDSYVPVWVNSKTAHAPPRKRSGHLTHWKNFAQFPGMLTVGQMPLRLVLQKASNPQPTSHYSKIYPCVKPFIQMLIIVYSRKPTFNGLFQRFSNAPTKQWI